jgi:hypothetical protein
MIEEEDGGLTFSDEDFDRRYSSGGASGAAGPSRPAVPTTNTPTAPIGRSRNTFMRTLLRRRLAAASRT